MKLKELIFFFFAVFSENKQKQTENPWSDWLGVPIMIWLWGWVSCGVNWNLKQSGLSSMQDDQVVFAHGVVAVDTGTWCQQELLHSYPSTGKKDWT